MTLSPSLLYLNRNDIRALGGDSPDLYVRAVNRALRLHSEDDIVQPIKPYLRQTGNGHIADRIIAMPAYIGGDSPVSGLKWIGSKHDNPSERGMERASGVIVLNDPQTNYPIAILEASLISGMRTAAVTVIGARHLAIPSFTSVSCIGCGTIAEMQMRSLIEEFPSINEIRLFDLRGEAADRLAAELNRGYSQVTTMIAENVESAVRAGEVVVTCTVADRPYIPYRWLRKGAFVSNISIMDLQEDVFLQADKVVVDDWDQANREKKTINQLVLAGKFSREMLHAELGEIVSGRKPGRQSPDEIIVLNPMGLAIEDISSAQEIYLRAIHSRIGTRMPLYGT